MARLMVGSEGTLGVVLEAKLALVALPRFKAVLAIQFADLLEALEATPAILAHRPSAVEVMDGFILAHTRQSPALEKLTCSGVSPAIGLAEAWATGERFAPPVKVARRIVPFDPPE